MEEVHPVLQHSGRWHVWTLFVHVWIEAQIRLGILRSHVQLCYDAKYGESFRINEHRHVWDEGKFPCSSSIQISLLFSYQNETVSSRYPMLHFFYNVCCSMKRMYFA